MAVVFRAKYCEALLKAMVAGEIMFPDYGSGLASRAEFARAIKSLWQKKWVVYSKMAFGGPERVVEYIGRYTHRVAISNGRILDVRNARVSFTYKDYRDGNNKKIMSVSAEEFIRRFLIHVLPEGFVRVRHYGLVANGRKQTKLAECRKLMVRVKQESKAEPAEDEYEKQAWKCPHCHVGRMVIKSTFNEGSGPPDNREIAQAA
jgi:hypothetical protein